MKYLKEHAAIIRNGIKTTNYNLLLVMLFELLFYAALAASGALWISRLTARMRSLQEFGLEKAFASKEALDAALPFYRNFLLFLWGSVLFLIVAAFLSFAISRYLIWWRISGAKFSAKACLKMLVLIIIWALIAAIPLAIAIAPIAKNAALQGVTAPNPALAAPLLAVMAVIFYLSNTSFALFAKEWKLGTVLKVPRQAVLRIHHTIVPFIVLTIIIGLIGWVLAAAPKASGIIMPLLLLTALSWTKFHLYQTIGNA